MTTLNNMWASYSSIAYFQCAGQRVHYFQTISMLLTIKTKQNLSLLLVQHLC